jgi:hypothetical protein
VPPIGANQIPRRDALLIPHKGDQRADPFASTIASAGIDHIVADGVFVRGDFAAVASLFEFPVARHRRSHVGVSWRNVSTYME